MFPMPMLPPFISLPSSSERYGPDHHCPKCGHGFNSPPSGDLSFFILMPIGVMLVAGLIVSMIIWSTERGIAPPYGCGDCTYVAYLWSCVLGFVDLIRHLV